MEENNFGLISPSTQKAVLMYEDVPNVAGVDHVELIYRFNKESDFLRYLTYGIGSTKGYITTTDVDEAYEKWNTTLTNKYGRNFHGTDDPDTLKLPRSLIVEFERQNTNILAYKQWLVNDGDGYVQIEVIEHDYDGDHGALIKYCHYTSQEMAQYESLLNADVL